MENETHQSTHETQADTASSRRSVRDVGQKVKGDLAELRDAAYQQRREALEQVTTLVREHPIAAVSIALGAGYLLSGALVSRTTARLVALGGRMYFKNWLRQILGGELSGLLGASFSGLAGGAGGGERSVRAGSQID